MSVAESHESHSAKVKRAFKIFLVGDFVGSLLPVALVLLFGLATIMSQSTYRWSSQGWGELGWVFLFTLGIAQVIALPISLTISLVIVYIGPIRRRVALAVVMLWAFLLKTGIGLFDGKAGFDTGASFALFCGVLGLVVVPLVWHLTRDWHVPPQISPSMAAS